MSIINKLPPYRTFFGVLPTIIVCLILISLVSSRKEAEVELRLLVKGVSFSQKDGSAFLLRDIPVEAISITGFKETIIKPQSLYWKKITPAGNIRKQEISWGIGIQLLPVGNHPNIEVVGDKLSMAELWQGSEKNSRVSFQIKGRKPTLDHSQQEGGIVEIGLDGCKDSKIRLSMTDPVKLRIKGCSVGRVNEPPERGMPETFWMIPSGVPLDFSPNNDKLTIWMRLLPGTKGFPIIQGNLPLKDFKFDREINDTILFQETRTGSVATDTLLVNGKVVQAKYISLDTNKLQVKEIRLDNDKKNWIVTMTGKTKNLRIGQTKDNLTEYLPSCLDDVYHNSSWILIFLALAWLFGTIMAFLG